jgi:iron complex outermembrane receptor protein
MTMRQGLAFALLGALALALPARGADTAPADSELALFDDLPVVLSAARLRQPLRDVPGAVTVIDRDMIRASGARHLADLLAYVPGFQVGHAFGSTPLTTYHGLSDNAPRRMLVRVDGRSAYSPYFVSGVDWSTLSVDIDDIDRIEVFRGTNAAAYGSNAFLGIVNIITRPAADSPRLRARVSEGANGLREQMVSVRQRLGDATARLTFGQLRSDGLDPLADTYRNQRLDARVDWQLGAHDELAFHFGMVDNRTDRGVAGEVTDPPRTVDGDTDFAQVRWRHQFGPGEELRVTYFHQEERSDDPGFFLPSLLDYLVNQRGLPAAYLTGVVFPTYGIPADTHVDGSSRTRALRDDIEFEHLSQATDTLRIVWGGGLRSDRVASARIFDTDDDIDVRQSRLFANLEQRLPPHWTINAGAMLEDTDSVGPRLSPRLALNAHLDARTTARVAVSRGYRNLTPFERLADARYKDGLAGVTLLQTFQPSGERSPERITTQELGLRHESADGRSHIDLRIYEERIRDLLRRVTLPTNVVPVPPLNTDGDTPTYRSDAKADIRGAEVSFLYLSTHDTWIGGHYAYTDLNSNDPSADVSAPRHAYSLFAATSLYQGWQVSARFGFVGHMAWYDDDDDAVVPPYHTLGIRLARQWQSGPAQFELAVGMDRIGGSIADYLPEQTRPTQGYVTLRMSY